MPRPDPRIDGITKVFQPRIFAGDSTGGLLLSLQERAGKARLFGGFPIIDPTLNYYGSGSHKCIGEQAPVLLNHGDA